MQGAASGRLDADFFVVSILPQVSDGSMTNADGDGI